MQTLISKHLTQNLQPVLVVVGPTASGKTAQALKLAQIFDGEIIAADSRQVYHYLQIGTAQPSVEERTQVVHHLVDFLEPDMMFNVVDFVVAAKTLISEIQGRGKVPIVVGGTGFFIDALIFNFDLPPCSTQLRAQLEQLLQTEGTRSIYDRLKVVDPVSAEKIGQSNGRRLVRALEIVTLTGQVRQTFSTHRATNFQALWLGIALPRNVLYERIAQRVDMMWEQGFVAEVVAVLARGFAADCVGLRSLGYAEIIRYLAGEFSKLETKQAIVTATRHYAKKQIIWHRRNKEIIFTQNIVEDLHHKG